MARTDVEHNDAFRRTGLRLRIPFEGSRLAVIGDVHGNLPALHAAIHDAVRRGAGLVVSTGDIVGYGPWPQACIDFIRERCIPVAQGNYDRGAGEGLADCGCAYRTARERRTGQISLSWTTRAINDEGRQWLRGLPFALEIAGTGGQPLAVVFHGSPRRVNEYVREDRPLGSLGALLAGDAAPVAVCGHTHVPYVRPLGGNRLLVNAGSAGRPRHGRPLATYAMIHLGRLDDPALPAGEPSEAAELIEVPYEADRAASAVLASGLPEEFAVMLRTGQGD
ncbi:MAG: metallophosphoesterase family protein [Bacillota bacterium]|nr:metallophosphoesterase family protein [Bacillota bacterium]